MKYLLKNKILLILLILVFWLVPTTISVPEQSSTETIVTAIGVDKDNDEYELSLQYIIPSNQNETKSLNISSYKAKTIGEAMEGLNLQLGKLSGYAHCRFLILSNNATKKDNVTNILDYLLRRKTNTNNIVLVSTPNKAKEILETANNLDSDLYAFLNNSGFSNELKDYHNLKTIGDYYKNYFSESKSISINVLEIKDKDSEDSQEKEPKKLIVNEGKLDIFKDDKKIVSLSKEQSKNLSFFDEGITKTYFIVENINDGVYLENAKVLFNVKKKDVKKEPLFIDGVPHLKMKFKLFLRIGQIQMDNLEQSDYETIQKEFSKKLKEKMKESLINQFKQAENNLKENNYDTIDCYNTFNRFKSKEWKDYLSKLENKDDFIKNVIFDYEITFVQGE